MRIGKPTKSLFAGGYDIADIALWCDYVDMLGSLGKDTHNAHFVCPEDLQEAHDTAQRKLLSQRDTGKIPFSMVGHKCYYKESDITEALKAQTE